MVYLSGDEARLIEPNLSDKVLGVVDFKKSGSVNPKKMSEQMGKMAANAGADIVLGQPVIDITYLSK